MRSPAPAVPPPPCGVGQNSAGHNALLLNEDTSADNDWQAMGVGIYGTYVVGVVWRRARP